jgi:hypothetical protein
MASFKALGDAPCRPRYPPLLIDLWFGGGAVHDRRLCVEQMIDQRLLQRPRPGQGPTRAQRHRLAVLDPVEAERERRRGEAVQRGDGRGQPLGRRSVEVLERDERDMEEVAPREESLRGSAVISASDSGGGLAMA